MVYMKRHAISNMQWLTREENRKKGDCGMLTKAIVSGVLLVVAGCSAQRDMAVSDIQAIDEEIPDPPGLAKMPSRPETQRPDTRPVSELTGMELKRYRLERAEKELAKWREAEKSYWEKTQYHNDRGEVREAAAAYLTLQLAIKERKQKEARVKSMAAALYGLKQARSGPKKTMETYGDCGTATGRDDRTNEKIHMMTCRGYGKNAMLLAFVIRNREPQLEIRLTPADIGNETERFGDDQDGSVAVAILIDKRPVLNRFALWDAPSDMALLYETDVFHSLLKDVAKGYKATIQIGEMVGGTVELGGSAAAIRDLRERAREDGISLSVPP